MAAKEFILITAAIAGILLLGFHQMCQLDRFSASGGFSDSTAARAEHAVLVFGEMDVTEPLACYLRSKGITYQVIDRPDVVQDACFLAVVAASRSDLDNLVLCSCAKRLWPDVLSFAVCNDATYRNVFRSVGIDCVFDGNPGRPALLESMKGWVENHV